jgi:hypothetical protein
LVLDELNSVRYLFPLKSADASTDSWDGNSTDSIRLGVFEHVSESKSDSVQISVGSWHLLGAQIVDALVVLIVNDELGISQNEDSRLYSTLVLLQGDWESLSDNASNTSTHQAKTIAAVGDDSFPVGEKVSLDFSER